MRARRSAPAQDCTAAMIGTIKRPPDIARPDFMRPLDPTYSRPMAYIDQTGNLKSGKELTVEKKQESGNTYITIEPTSPDVVYVPAYNPTVVYGAWAYPAYPP